MPIGSVPGVWALSLNWLVLRTWLFHGFSTIVQKYYLNNRYFVYGALTQGLLGLVENNPDKLK